MNNLEKKGSALKGFLLHLHPKIVNEQAIKYSRTFGLGGMNALLFFILAFTGLLLRFSYIPTPDDAYNSIIALQDGSILGSILRNIHHWSAVLMVVTAFLHLIRVFYTQSIYYERKKNWYYGLFLFSLVLAFNFTGYLLPWDQLSFWAVSIMTNILEYIPLIGQGLANLIRGGETVTGNTLLNFYNFHTGVLPLLFIAFMMLHFWQIRKAKGVSVAEPNKKEMVMVNPDLIYKEMLVALILISVILLFSMLVDAPLLEKANPLISPNPSKAPWYFMGIQELLINLHPLMVSLILPVSLVIFFILIPKYKIDKQKVGTWFYSKNGKTISIISIVFSSILSFALVLILDYASHFNSLDIPLFVKTGIIPFLMYIVPTIVFLLYVRKVRKADVIELVISITTIIFSSYITLSIIGLFLRGEGMSLIF